MQLDPTQFDLFFGAGTYSKRFIGVLVTTLGLAVRVVATIAQLVNITVAIKRTINENFNVFAARLAAANAPVIQFIKDNGFAPPIVNSLAHLRKGEVDDLETKVRKVGLHLPPIVLDD